MIVTRRQILIGASAITAASFAGRLQRNDETRSIVSSWLVPRGVDGLLLHDGGATAMAFARDLRVSMSSSRSRVSDQAVQVLTLQGFIRVGALLDASRGRALLSLLDEGDSVVIEALLKARGASNLERRRHGNQALLTARL